MQRAEATVTHGATVTQDPNYALRQRNWSKNVAQNMQNRTSWDRLIGDLEICAHENRTLQEEVSDLREYIDLLALEDDTEVPKVAERLEELEYRLFPVEDDDND